MCKYTAKFVSPHATPTDLPRCSTFSGEANEGKRAARDDCRVCGGQGRGASLHARQRRLSLVLACTRPRAVGAEELELVSRQHLVGHDEQQLYFETSSGYTYSLRPCSTNLSLCCPP